MKENLEKDTIIKELKSRQNNNSEAEIELERLKEQYGEREKEYVEKEKKMLDILKDISQYKQQYQYESENMISQIEEKDRELEKLKSYLNQVQKRMEQSVEEEGGNEEIKKVVERDNKLDDNYLTLSFLNKIKS